MFFRLLIPRMIRGNGSSSFHSRIILYSDHIVNFFSLAGEKIVALVALVANVLRIVNY